MRKKENRRCFTVLICLIPLLFLGAEVHAGSGRADFKKCLSCHPEVKAELSASAVHSPFKGFECSSCHNPHAAKYEGLMRDRVDRLCKGCHEEQGEAGERQYVHDPFGRGQCLSCHRPHAAENAKLLKSKDQRLCFECHSQESGFGWPNKHDPVAQGECLACHSPHSSRHSGLVTKGREALCTGCHATANRRIEISHSGYSVSGTDCMSCHNPHGSNDKGLVKRARHAPFADGNCESCHHKAASGKRPAVRGQGVSVCVRCHPEAMKSFEAVYSHVGEGLFCVNCHSPHASDEEALRKAKEAKVCFGCHTDTERHVDRVENRYKHPLLEQNKCSPCHSPHGTNRGLFFASDEVTVCTACHERHAKFTHPIGEKAVDPRSGQRVSCITCHNLMGSGHRFSLRFDRKKELCIQCHKGY